MLQDPVFFQHLVTCGVAEADGTLKNLEVGILQENPRFCSRTRGFWSGRPSKPDVCPQTPWCRGHFPSAVTGRQQNEIEKAQVGKGTRHDSIARPGPAPRAKPLNRKFISVVRGKGNPNRPQLCHIAREGPSLGIDKSVLVVDAADS